LLGEVFFLVELGLMSHSLSGQVQGTAQDYYVNAQLPWHRAVLDSTGRLLAWYHPEKNLGYDQFLTLDWGFMEHRVPIDKATGLKVYLAYPVYDPETLQGNPALDWQHNPASTFAHFVDLLVGWYPYSGDDESIRVVREMLDYQLAHGTTPEDWSWASVPFPTSCIGDKEYGHCLRDAPKEFYGGIEPDKAGELGLGYVLFYEQTGDQKYLQAGLRCAEQLAKHIREGDAKHTPWPFRVDARTGKVIGEEEFGGMIVAPVRLFDELIRLGIGDTGRFRKARDLAWHWIMSFPMNPESPAWNAWTGYYEDVPKSPQNVNDMDALMTAYYILSQMDPSTVDPNWRTHVGYMLDWDRSILGRGPFLGAWAMDEQEDPSVNVYHTTGSLFRGCCSRAGLVCRTSAWGAISAMYYGKTGDGAARENAFRSLNYATYFARSNGEISCCGLDFPDEYWFEDSYADAGRSFMWALGAVPDFAPVGQSHLLRSSSVVKKVKYGNRVVEYTTFDDSGVEVFRLNFKPTVISAGNLRLRQHNDLGEDGYTLKELEGGDYEVRVRRSGATQMALKG
jgi:hypothetical protein